MHGTHLIKSWSSTQSIIASSSGEAEFYGVVKAGSAALGFKAMFMDMNRAIGLRIHTDAEAAKGMASRTGLGKTRHIAVHYLWVQERVRNGDLELRKVLGTKNPADLLTKHLTREEISKYMSTFHMSYRDGRAHTTPTV